MRPQVVVVNDLMQQGYRAMKWFLRRGPADGKPGVAENARVVSAIRGAVGDDVDIMLDAWMSWDLPYTVGMAEHLEDYAPRWIEEPVMPDKIQSYAEIRRQVRIPISGGEHEYTNRFARLAVQDIREAER